MSPAKPPGLKVRWSRREKDLVYCHDGTVDMPDGKTLTASKSDAGLLHYVFDVLIAGDQGRSIVDELHARGYDLETLRFTIRKKE